MKNQHQRKINFFAAALLILGLCLPAPSFGQSLREAESYVKGDVDDSAIFFPTFGYDLC
jgi:hypothetical protein